VPSRAGAGDLRKFGSIGYEEDGEGAVKTDEELMLAYAATADVTAFREIFTRYAPILLRLLTRQVGRPADAQDLVQHTFLQLHRARLDFNGAQRLRPWVMTIALNLARDLLRRRGRRPEVLFEETALPMASATQPVVEVAGDVGKRVRAALSELPRDQREVIELHWFEELSFNEIAQIVGANPGAVRVRAHRGYVTLRKTLDPGNTGRPGDVP
jgi:RNA polymerase sigma-70 factor (ECF subfamily)